MLEYVKRLLLMQTKLAAQFDAGQTPEIRKLRCMRRLCRRKTR